MIDEVLELGHGAVHRRPVLLRWCVEVAADLGRHAGHALEVLARRGQHRLRRAEVLEQRALAGRADAGQPVEDRLRHRGVAAGAVVGDREAVRLVADALEQLQLRRVVGEHAAGRATPGQEDLLDALGQRDDDDAALAEVRQRLDAGGELALAAVDDDHVGQRGEARVAVLVVGRQLALLGELRARGGAAPPPSRRSRRTGRARGRGCGSAGSRTSSARRPRRRPSRRRRASPSGWRCRSTRCGPGSESSCSASCRPSSASTRCWRRRSALSLSWSSASAALRSASSRMRRLDAALGGADLDAAAAALGEDLAEHVELRAVGDLAAARRSAPGCDSALA